MASYELYFISDPTDNKLLSNSITHGVSIILLLLLNCSNSLLVRGVRIDGEESGGECIEFDASQQNYLSLFYMKVEKQNKELLEQNTKPLLDENSVNVVVVRETNKI